MAATHLPPPPATEAPAADDLVNNEQWFRITFDDVPGSQSSHFCDIEECYSNQEEALNDDDSSLDLISPKTEVVDDGASGIQVQVMLPPPRVQPTSFNFNYSRLSVILLDQGLFTVYKCLFVVVFTTNIIVLGLVMSGFLPRAKERAVLVSILNILVLTLCRSEALLRIVFWIAVKVLGRPTVPLWIKLAVTAFLQSLGGIHSGCGVSSVAWLVYGLRLALKQEDTTTAIIAIASTILSLLCLTCLVAFPLVRHLHHNVFERTHRFAGWAALVLVWVFVVLTALYDPETKSYKNFGNINIRSSELLELWLTLVITFFTILPWVTMRRVPVSVTASSGHASLIKFAGGVSPGILGRISRSPFSEWHAFGIISNGEKSHMMLAGAVGDFTRSLVSDPPSHLWVRRVHFAGLPYLVNMYGRVVLVATGSGICVFLSFLLQLCSADVCVVWVAKGVQQNFGKEIEGMMMSSRYPVGKVIVHDTAISGRPDITKMTIEAAKSWKAEVVVVTSNPQGSRDIVRTCKAAGVPAFGPIWDS